MQYLEKQLLFDNFLSKWQSQFEKVPFVLYYISTYPEIVKKIEKFCPLNLEQLKNSQLEWISLVAQLDNPIETTFFKDYWIPIQNGKYDYFIDLSSESLSLFKVYYFSSGLHRWYKNYIFKDLNQFLIDVGKSNFSIEQHFKEVENNRKSIENDLLWERDELGLSGKLTLDPVDKGSIIIDTEENISYQDNCITLNGVNSTIVGLLPYDCKIKLTDFYLYVGNHNLYEKVKSVKALVYLLKNDMSIISYSIQFDSDKGCRAEFKDFTFKIVHTDKQFLKSFIEKYETYKNS